VTPFSATNLRFGDASERAEGPRPLCSSAPLALVATRTLKTRCVRASSIENRAYVVASTSSRVKLGRLAGDMAASSTRW